MGILNLVGLFTAKTLCIYFIDDVCIFVGIMAILSLVGLLKAKPVDSNVQEKSDV